MLYIISFQSISCREASPTSPRPHKGPPKGILHGPQGGSSSRFSERALGGLRPGCFLGHPLNLPPGFPHVAQLGPLAGLPLNLPPGFPHVAQLDPLAGLPLNLPPGFPHVAQLCPLAGPSKQFSSRPERRSSPRPPYPQVPQCHPGVAKPSSIIPSPRPPCPQIVQWHPHVPNNPTISLKPASKRTSTGPRHGLPIHRYLSAIPAWQSRHLSSLRHGHPAHKYLRSIPACRTITHSLSNRPQTGPRPVLATATLPTGTSGAFPRGKAVIYHPFATATLPTGTPVASPRAEQSNNFPQTGL